jgi:STE24 endopeptidase
MEVRRYRVPLAIVVAVAAAGVATVLLRPRSGMLEPASVELTAYFSPAELERAEDFRGPQRLIGIGNLVLSGLTLAVFALRPPRWARRALARAGARPLLGSLAAGAALSVIVTIVTLPLSSVAHERAVDVGLSTQNWAEWLGDVGKATAIGAVFAGAGAVIGVALIRRFPRRWWIPSSVAVVAISAAFVLLAPIVIDPVFNKFDPLPEGRLRGEVLQLAERSGVDVGEVYRIDASRRTTGANAYVGGLGHTKRVVLYDNLIEDFPPEEVRSVVAHELGHVKHDDVPRGILWIAIVAPAGMLLAQRLTESFERRGNWKPPAWPIEMRSPFESPRARGGPAGPAVVPALALAIALVTFGGNVAGNQMSRPVEARADAYSLELTNDPDAHIALERRISVRNVSDPDPPTPLHVLFGTHPKTIDRIGYGVTWEREH